MSTKEYDPHIVVYWVSDDTIAAFEFPNKKDAETKYYELDEAHTLRVVLAKVIRSHDEG